MRNELEHIEEIERYLNGKMTQGELHAFESKLKNDENLQYEVDLQKQLVNRLKENAFKSELLSFHTDFINNESKFNFKKIALNTGIGLFITTISIAGIYYLVSQKENKKPQEVLYTAREISAEGSSEKAYLSTEALDESEDATLIAQKSESKNLTKPNSPLTGQRRKTFDSESPCRNFLLVFNEAEINAELGGEIITEISKSKINIPAGVIVDKNGNPVSGNVQIKYREYRNSAHMAFSQIPMVYSENGLNYNFNSVGMFEIRAFQNGEELEIAKGKTFTVDYSCTESLDTTYFFALDDKSQKWKKLNDIKFQAPLVLNEGKIIDTTSQVSNLGTPSPNAQLFTRVTDVSTGKYIPVSFEIIDGESYYLEKLIFENDSNYVAYEMNSPSQNARWSLKIKSPGFDPLIIDSVLLVNNKVTVIDAAMKPERAESDMKHSLGKRIIHGFRNVFSSKSKKPKSDAPKYYHHSAVRDTLFNAIELKKPEKELINKKGGAFIGNNLKSNNVLLAENSNLGHTYPTIVKGLNCANFGVYNCDQIYAVKNQVIIQPKFLDESGVEIKEQYVLSMIDLNYNGAFSFDPKSFTCSATGKNVLLLFTTSKKIYAVNSDNFSAMKIKSSGNYSFTMRDMTEIIKNTIDLENFLGLKSV